MLTSHIPLLNREIGLLEFNSRVLAQAEDLTVPLLERLRYVCIVSSNMDEFFEIRMAGLKAQLEENPNKILEDGLTIGDSYQRITEFAHHLVNKKYALLQQSILPALASEKVIFKYPSTWTPKLHQWARDFFHRELVPLLTPIALDPAHPFPRVINKSLNFLVSLDGKDSFGRSASLAVVQAPRSLPRVVRVPKQFELKGETCFILLSSFMQAFVGELFPGIKVTGCYQFRVTRNSDLFVSEDDITDLRSALQGELPTRHLGDAVRLEINASTPDKLVERILNESNLQESDCYRVSGPVNLVRLVQIPDLIDRPDLKFTPATPQYPAAFMQNQSIFETISKRDVLLHHPYESFEPVLELLRQASKDPQVLAIKQTVYRTGDESLVMDALMEAAKNGKEVTVVVELLARFDEQTNMQWAAKLEAVGAHVIYGVVGHKCHAKMLLIVRRETIIGARGRSKSILKRYAHLGTGNYHPRTAKLYTDFGLLTAHEEITSDVHLVFQLLTGTGKQITLSHLWQSPFTMQEEIIKHIRAETRAAKAGKKGYIIAKMNALLEPSVIQELYRASQAGVKIELIIRGVCALMPGVPGLSENIKVRSIIGRFLEHHRIYYFYANGLEKVYLSSADWMDRNLYRRVEIAFPILDPQIKARVIFEGLKATLQDNQAAWLMQREGHYQKIKSKSKYPFIAQQGLLKMLQG
jgi:polyphosphate kinase